MLPRRIFGVVYGYLFTIGYPIFRQTGRDWPAITSPINTMIMSTKLGESPCMKRFKQDSCFHYQQKTCLAVTWFHQTKQKNQPNSMVPILCWAPSSMKWSHEMKPCQPRSRLDSCPWPHQPLAPKPERPVTWPWRRHNKNVLCSLCIYLP